MARNFDNWDNYTVEDKPFYGRFTFYKLHTTEKVEITTESGTPIDNPILSDTYGRTSQQVFLPDVDVTVKLEKYIGGGDMSENPDDISAWSEVRTFDNLNQKYIPEENANDHMVTVGTTEDLSEFTQYDHEYAMVLGYYEIGDMPPAYYHLELNSISTPDGGSIIRSDPTHIWRLVTPQILDIRVFGVFPSQTAVDTQGYDSQFRNAYSYANSKGISMYMPKVYNKGYYSFNGGAHTIANTLYVDNGVVLSGKSGTTSVLTVDKIEGAASGLLEYNQYNSGNLTLNVKSARSSWLADWNQPAVKIVPSEELIIDSQTVRSPFTISNLNHVYIEQSNYNPGGRVTFSNIVNFESPGRLSMDGDFSFSHMTEIKDSWWNLTDSNHKLDLANVDVDASCTMYLDDFLYVENFCRLSYANGIKTFNLEGRLYEASVTDRYDGCTFLNGEIRNLHLTGNVTLRDISGTVYTNPQSAWIDVSIEDSYITGSVPFNITGDVYIKSSSFISTFVAGSSLPVFHGTSCVIRDSIFNGYLVQVPYNAIITGCTFDLNDQGAYSNINVYANATNGYVSCTFSDNILNGSKVTLMQQSAQYLITVVNSVFVGNSITNSRDGTNFIKWTNIARTGHVYTYKNNDGPNVLQTEDYANFIRLIPMIPEGTTPTTTKYVTYSEPWRDPDHSEYVDMWYRRYRVYGVTLADFNLFAFGDDDYAQKYAEWNFSCQENSSYPSEAYWGSGSAQALSIKGSGCNRNGIGAMSAANIPNPWETAAGYNNAVDTMHIVTPTAYCDLKLKVNIYDARVVT